MTVWVARIALFCLDTAVTVMVVIALIFLVVSLPLWLMLAMLLSQSTDQTTPFSVASAGIITALSVMDLPAATLPAPSMVSPVTPLTTRRVMLPLTLLPSFAVAVMVTLPVLRAVTRPLASTVAILLLLLDHVTSAIASSGSHVAFSCKVLLPLKSTYVVGALTVIFFTPGAMHRRKFA